VARSYRGRRTGLAAEHCLGNDAERCYSVNQCLLVCASAPYRFFFYSGDREEPPHTHVERDRSIAKFWLEPVRLQNSGGYSRNEISRIERLVEENRDHLLRCWNEFFNG